jgi:ketosteroid isomerase-like protein
MTNSDIVRRGYEAFGRGDLDTLLSLFDENIDWMTPGPPELPTAGRRRGRQEVAGFFKALGDSFEVQRFEPKEYIEQGDRVVVLGEEIISVKGTTGQRLELMWAHVFELRDGKIVRFREYGDTGPAVAAFNAAHAATTT